MSTEVHRLHSLDVQALVFYLQKTIQKGSEAVCCYSGVGQMAHHLHPEKFQMDIGLYSTLSDLEPPPLRWYKYTAQESKP